MTASKIPAFLHEGLCKSDIFVAQDLNDEFASLHPLKETLKDRAFRSGGDGSERVAEECNSFLFKIVRSVSYIFDRSLLLSLDYYFLLHQLHQHREPLSQLLKKCIINSIACVTSFI
ncbi:Uncharacterized protein Rs2_03315 [Raphanus sativus]|nr:Uncharacterized protein Rs2_03315 [Raphanus sativus]